MCKMSGFIRDGCESEVNPFLKRSLQKDCEKFCRRIGVPPFSLKNKCVLNDSKWPETKFGNFFVWKTSVPSPPKFSHFQDLPKVWHWPFFFKKRLHFQWDKLPEMRGNCPASAASGHQPGLVVWAVSVSVFWTLHSHSPAGVEHSYIRRSIYPKSV